MSSEEDQDRASIMTYIPQYQKDVWVEHAAALGMSQSEFVRTMVQAGRRDFPVDTLLDAPAESTESRPATPDLQRRVVSMIGEAGVLDWEALLAEVRGDIESELEEALAALQEANRIRYDGRQGGYVRTGDE
jgi:hypothetical protein